MIKCAHFLQNVQNQKSRLLKDSAFVNQFDFLLYQRSGILNTCKHHEVRFSPIVCVQRTIWFLRMENLL